MMTRTVGILIAVFILLVGIIFAIYQQSVRSLNFSEEEDLSVTTRTKSNEALNPNVQPIKESSVSQLSQLITRAIPRDIRYAGVTIQYPKGFTVNEGWGWGEDDIHFISPDKTSAIHFVRENPAGYCFHDICAQPSLAKLVRNKIMWDVIGSTEYCDVGVCFKNDTVYRTVNNPYRYLLIFNGFSKEDQLTLLNKFSFSEIREDLSMVYWPRYQNLKLNFELAYPLGWTQKIFEIRAEAPNELLSFSLRQNGANDISATFHVFKGPLKEIERQLPVFSVPGRIVDSRITYTRGNLTWTEIWIANQVLYITEKDDKTYALQTSPYVAEIPSILKTFRFLEN